MPSLGQQNRAIVHGIERIESRMFTVDDISLLLIRLRERAYGEKIFREIADFVAHPERDKGITSDALSEMYFSMKLFTEYVLPKRQLDPLAPFPNWIRKLIQYRSDAPDARLKEKFGLSPGAFKQLERASYHKTSNDSGYYTPSATSPNWLPAVVDLLQAIHVRPAYSQAGVIKSFCDVLRRNALVDEPRIDAILRDRGSELTTALLCILHQSVIQLGDAEGRCSIGVNPETGKVALMGMVPLLGTVSSVFVVMETELDAIALLVGFDRAGEPDVQMTADYKLRFT